MRQYVSTLSEQIDPSGRRPTWDGAAWVSQDGKFWWNGTTWQPIVRKRQTPWGVIGFVVVVLAIIAIVVVVFPRKIIDTNHYGATNATIDGPNQIEFDYVSQDSCNNLTFVYTFYNPQGIKVSEFKDSLPRQVNAGQSYHFTIALNDAIDPSASRFTVTPNCSS